MFHVQAADEHRGANTLFLVSPDYKTVVAKPVGVSQCGAACFPLVLVVVRFRAGSVRV
jgi:hypothetical protein